MTPIYERRVIGGPLIIFCSAITVMLALALALDETNDYAWFSLAFMALPLIMGVMTISVSNTALRIRFLLGFPARKIDVDTIAAMRVTHSWRETGFGLSVSPLRGRFCTCGPSALSILLKNGRTVLVGTPEPEKLLKALNRARDRYAGGS